MIGPNPPPKSLYVVPMDDQRGASTLRRMPAKRAPRRTERDSEARGRRMEGQLGSDVDVETYRHALTLIGVSDGAHQAAVEPCVREFGRFMRRSGRGTQTGYERLYFIAWVLDGNVIFQWHGRDFDFRSPSPEAVAQLTEQLPDGDDGQTAVPLDDCLGSLPKQKPIDLVLCVSARDCLCELPEALARRLQRKWIRVREPH